MKKTIYEGIDSGLYVFGDFEKFMKRIPAAELVRGKFSLGELYQVWHLNEVTIHYEHDKRETNPKVKVNLHGATAAISEVEKLILLEHIVLSVQQKNS
jgi:hypothetical protein